jgi:hypothetical protein
MAIFLCLAVVRVITGEWIWHDFMSRTKAEPLPKPTPQPNPTPQPVKAESPSLPEYIDYDPLTHIKYKKDVPFYPGNHQDPNAKEGGDAKTPGNPWSYSWTAPGPVASVAIDSGAASQGGEHCVSDQNVATCTGWINGGNVKRWMTVTWLQKNVVPK